MFHQKSLCPIFAEDLRRELGDTLYAPDFLVVCLQPFAGLFSCLLFLFVCLVFFVVKNAVVCFLFLVFSAGLF